MVALLNYAYATLNDYSSGTALRYIMEMLMLSRTEMSLFGLYFHRSMLYSSTKVATRWFVRHLENLGTTTPLFNDIYFRTRVMLQLRGHCINYYIRVPFVLYLDIFLRFWYISNLHLGAPIEVVVPIWCCISMGFFFTVVVVVGGFFCTFWLLFTSFVCTISPDLSLR